MGEVNGNFSAKTSSISVGSYSIVAKFKGDTEYEACQTEELTLTFTSDEEKPTSIKDVNTDQIEVTKVLENGNLIIIRNGEKYNVQGIKME